MLWPQCILRIWQMESRKTKGGKYDFGGPSWYVFNTYWRLTLLSVQRQRSRGSGGPKLLLQDTLQHTSSFVKRFVYLAVMYHWLCTNGPSQTEILLLWPKIPVILDLIKFEIFKWRLVKIAFPGFQISTFSGGAICPKKPLEARPFGARSISRC